jgi:HPt (histidine-containing phosphotransfer) domain-containing protein
VLTDLQMPGLCGNELAHELRQVVSDATRLIAISASVPGSDHIDAFDGFLMKPFTSAALATALAAEPRTLPAETPPRSGIALDPTVYDTLSTSMRPEVVAQLYRLCLSDVRKRLSTMREAAERNDGATYRREAHAIKGGAGMVGAVELQTLASTLEIRGIPANHVATLDEFLRACDRLQGMLIARETAPDRSVTAEIARRSTHEGSCEEVR